MEFNDRYGLSAYFQFSSGNSSAQMRGVQAQLEGITRAVNDLESATQGTRAGKEFGAIAHQMQTATRRTEKVVDRMGSTAVATLKPLKAEFRALRAEAKLIDFGDLANPRQFKEASTQVKQYVADLRHLEHQIVSTTASEREFVATLKQQQRAAQDRLDMLDNQRKAALAAERVGTMGAVRDVGQSIMDPLGGAGRDMVKLLSDFNDQMSAVQAVSGASAKDLETLRTKAKDLGATTRFSASEAASGLIFLAQAGYTTEQQLSSIDGTLMLAASGALGLEEATNITVATLGGFQLAAQDAKHAADVLAWGAAAGATDVTELGEAMKYVAPVSKAFGSSLDQTTAALALLSNAGIKSSQAGTALRAGMSRLAAPKGPAMGVIAKINETLGHDLITDAQTGKIRDFTTILEDLGTAMQPMGQAEKISVIQKIFGTEALSAFSYLIDNTDKMRELTKAANESSEGMGAATQMAQVMENNLGGAFRNLSSAFEGVQLALIEPLEPMLRQIVNTTGAFLGKIAALPQPVLKAIAITGALTFGIAALAVAVGTAGVALFGIQQAMATSAVASLALSRGLLPLTGFFESAMGAFSAGLPLNLLPIFMMQMVAILGPIALLAGAIAGIIALIKHLKPELDLMQSGLFYTAKGFGFAAGFVRGFWDVTKEAFPQIQQAIDKLSGLIHSDVVRTFQDLTKKPREFIQAAMADWRATYAESFTSGEELGKKIAQKLLAPFLEQASRVELAWAWAKSKIVGLWGQMVSAATWVRERIVGLLNHGSADHVAFSWQRSVDFIQIQWQRLIQFAKDTRDSLIEAFVVANSAFHNYMENPEARVVMTQMAIEKLKRTLSGAMETFRAFGKAIVENLDFPALVAFTLSSLPQNLVQMIENNLANSILAGMMRGLPTAIAYLLPALMGYLIGSGAFKQIEKWTARLGDWMLTKFVDIAAYALGPAGEKMAKEIESAIRDAAARANEGLQIMEENIQRFVKIFSEAPRELDMVFGAIAGGLLALQKGPMQMLFGALSGGAFGLSGLVPTVFINNMIKGLIELGKSGDQLRVIFRGILTVFADMGRLFAAIGKIIHSLLVTPLKIVGAILKPFIGYFEPVRKATAWMRELALRGVALVKQQLWALVGLVPGLQEGLIRAATVLMTSYRAIAAVLRTVSRYVTEIGRNLAEVISKMGLWSGLSDIFRILGRYTNAFSIGLKFAVGYIIRMAKAFQEVRAITPWELLKGFIFRRFSAEVERGVNKKLRHLVKAVQAGTVMIERSSKVSLKALEYFRYLLPAQLQLIGGIGLAAGAAYLALKAIDRETLRAIPVVGSLVTLLRDFFILFMERLLPGAITLLAHVAAILGVVAAIAVRAVTAMLNFVAAIYSLFHGAYAGLKLIFGTLAKGRDAVTDIMNAIKAGNDFDAPAWAVGTLKLLEHIYPLVHHISILINGIIDAVSNFANGIGVVVTALGLLVFGFSLLKTKNPFQAFLDTLLAIPRGIKMAFEAIKIGNLAISEDGRQSTEFKVAKQEAALKLGLVRGDDRAFQEEQVSRRKGLIAYQEQIEAEAQRRIYRQGGTTDEASMAKARAEIRNDPAMLRKLAYRSGDDHVRKLAESGAFDELRQLTTDRGAREFGELGTIGGRTMNAVIQRANLTIQELEKNPLIGHFASLGSREHEAVSLLDELGRHNTFENFATGAGLQGSGRGDFDQVSEINRIAKLLGVSGRTMDRLNQAHTDATNGALNERAYVSAMYQELKRHQSRAMKAYDQFSSLSDEQAETLRSRVAAERGVAEELRAAGRNAHQAGLSVTDAIADFAGQVPLAGGALQKLVYQADEKIRPPALNRNFSKEIEDVTSEALNNPRSMSKAAREGRAILNARKQMIHAAAEKKLSVQMARHLSNAAEALQSGDQARIATIPMEHLQKLAVVMQQNGVRFADGQQYRKTMSREAVLQLLEPSMRMANWRQTGGDRASIPASVLSQIRMAAEVDAHGKRTNEAISSVMGLHGHEITANNTAQVMQGNLDFMEQSSLESMARSLGVSSADLYDPRGAGKGTRADIVKARKQYFDQVLQEKGYKNQAALIQELQAEFGDGDDAYEDIPRMLNRMLRGQTTGVSKDFQEAVANKLFEDRSRGGDAVFNMQNQLSASSLQARQSAMNATLGGRLQNLRYSMNPARIKDSETAFAASQQVARFNLMRKIAKDDAMTMRDRRDRRQGFNDELRRQGINEDALRSSMGMDVDAWSQMREDLSRGIIDRLTSEQRSALLTNLGATAEELTREDEDRLLSQMQAKRAGMGERFGWAMQGVRGRIAPPINNFLDSDPRLAKVKGWMQQYQQDVAADREARKMSLPALMKNQGFTSFNELIGELQAGSGGLSDRDVAALLKGSKKGQKLSDILGKDAAFTVAKRMGLTTDIDSDVFEEFDRTFSAQYVMPYPVKLASKLAGSLMGALKKTLAGGVGNVTKFVMATVGEPISRFMSTAAREVGYRLSEAMQGLEEAFPGAKWIKSTRKFFENTGKAISGSIDDRMAASRELRAQMDGLVRRIEGAIGGALQGAWEAIKRVRFDDVIKFARTGIERVGDGIKSVFKIFGRRGRMFRSLQNLRANRDLNNGVPIANDGGVFRQEEMKKAFRQQQREMMKRIRNSSLPVIVARVIQGAVSGGMALVGKGITGSFKLASKGFSKLSSMFSPERTDAKRRRFSVDRLYRRKGADGKDVAGERDAVPSMVKGDPLLGVAAAFQGAARTASQKAAQFFANGAEKAEQSWKGMVDRVRTRDWGNLVMDAQRAMRKVANGVGEAVSGVGDRIAMAFGNSALWVRGMWDRTVMFLSGTWDKLTGFARGVGRRLKSLLSENSPGPSQHVREKWEETSESVQHSMNEMGDHAEATGKRMGFPVAALGKIVGIMGAVAGVGGMFSTIAGSIEETHPQMAAMLNQLSQVTFMIDGIAGGLMAMGQMTGQFAEFLGDEELQGFAGNVRDRILSLGSQLKESAAPILTPMMEGMQKLSDRFMIQVWEPAKTRLKDAMVGASKSFREWVDGPGKSLLSKFKQGFWTAYYKVAIGADKVFAGIQGAIAKSFQGAASLVSKAVTPIVGVAQRSADGFASAMQYGLSRVLRGYYNLQYANKGLAGMMTRTATSTGKALMSLGRSYYGAVFTMLGPLLPWMIGIAAVTGILYLAWKNNFMGMRAVIEPLFKFMLGLTKIIGAFLMVVSLFFFFRVAARFVFSFIRALFGLVKHSDAAKAAAEGLNKGIVGTLLSGIRAAWKGFWMFIDAILGVGEASVKLNLIIDDMGYRLAFSVRDMIANIKDSVIEFFKWMVHHPKQVFGAIAGIVSWGANLWWNVIRIFAWDVAGIFIGIGTIVASLVSGISKAFLWVQPYIGEFIAFLLSAMPSVEGFGGILLKPFEWLSDHLEEIGGWITMILEKAGSLADALNPSKAVGGWLEFGKGVMNDITGKKAVQPSMHPSPAGVPLLASADMNAPGGAAEYVANKWDQTTSFVNSQIASLVGTSESAGDELRGNLAEASPGPTWWIRKKWAFTVFDLKRKFNDLVFHSEETGDGMGHAILAGAAKMAYGTYTAISTVMGGISSVTRGLQAQASGLLLYYFGISTASMFAFLPMIGMIALVVLGLIAIATNFLGIRTILTGLGKIAAGVGDALISALISVVRITRGILMVLAGIPAAIMGDFSGIEAGIREIFNGIREMAAGLVRAIGRIFSGAVQIFEGIFKGFATVVKEGVFGSMLNSTHEFASKSRQVIENLSDRMSSAMMKPAQAWNGLMGKIGRGKQKIEAEVGAATAPPLARGMASVGDVVAGHQPSVVEARALRDFDAELAMLGNDPIAAQQRQRQSAGSGLTGAIDGLSQTEDQLTSLRARNQEAIAATSQGIGSLGMLMANFAPQAAAPLFIATDLFDTFTSLSAALPVLATAFAGMGGVVGVVGTVFTAVAGAATTMWAAITGPIGIAILAIAAVVAVLFLLYKAARPIIRFLVGGFQLFMSIFKDEFGAAIAPIFNAFSDAWANIKSAFGELWQVVSSAFQPLLEIFGLGGGGAGGAVRGIMTAIARFILGPLSLVAKVVGFLIRLVGGVLATAIRALVPVVSLLLAPLRMVAMVVKGIASIFQVLSQLIVAGIQMWWNTIPAPLRWAIEKGSGMVSGLLGAGKGGNTNSPEPRRFAKGGPVGGQGTGDRILALLDPREFVINPGATKRNFGFLDAINSGMDAESVIRTVPIASSYSIPTVETIATINTSRGGNNGGSVSDRPIQVVIQIEQIVVGDPTQKDAAEQMVLSMEPAIRQAVLSILRDQVEMSRST